MVRGINKTGLLVSLLLLAVIALSNWLQDQPPPQDRPTATGPGDDIDFFLEDFQIRQHDKRGRTHYTVAGERLNHYAISDHSEILKPRIKLQQAGNAYWSITAREAIASSEELDEVRLRGNVITDRPETADKAAIRLQSETLLINPAAEIVSSDSPVTIESGRNRIEAASLHADLDKGIYTLQQAKGVYVP